MQLQCNTLFFLILAETSEHSFANIFDLSETEKKKQTPKNKTQKTPKQTKPPQNKTKKKTSLGHPTKRQAGSRSVKEKCCFGEFTKQFLYFLTIPNIH